MGYDVTDRLDSKRSPVHRWLYRSVRVPYVVLLPASYVAASLLLLGPWFNFTCLGGYSWYALSWPVSHWTARENILLQCKWGMVEWAVLGLIADMIWLTYRLAARFMAPNVRTPP